MTKDRTQLIQEVTHYLEEAGFDLSSECDVRPSCFDLVARKDNQLLFVKLLTNIDALTKDDALSLQTVAHFFNATPLIIGRKTRRGSLDEGVVYQRYGLSTIAPRSFHSMISERTLPREFIQRGGRFVAIDGSKLKEIRLSHNLTKEDFAKCVQVSTRAILAYEKDEIDVSAEVAERIEKVLETDLVIPIDVLSRQFTQERSIPTIPFHKLPDLENRVNEFFERLGMKVLWTDRAPFHVAAKEDDQPLMSGVGSLKSWSLQKRMELIKNVSEITESDAVIIVEEGRAEETVSKLPVIRQLELDDIEEPSELKKIINERSS
jgi:putative transcriptional regulator